MSNFSAIIPVELMHAANAELEAKGYGPNNFSVPAYASAQATHGLFHSWSDPVFQADVELISGVVIKQEGEPATLVTEACNDVGATWGSDALPLTGVVTPGLYYYTDDSLWWVIQQYDTDIWPDPYAPGLTALVIPARVPGVVTEWVQPINQFNSYLLPNQFTGLGDQVSHNGKVWVTLVNYNVWEPSASVPTLWEEIT